MISFVRFYKDNVNDGTFLHSQWLFVVLCAENQTRSLLISTGVDPNRSKADMFAGRESCHFP